jgi:hypothetical protein
MFVKNIQNNSPEHPLKFYQQAFPAAEVEGGLIVDFTKNQAGGDRPKRIEPAFETIVIDVVEKIDILELDTHLGYVGRQH